MVSSAPVVDVNGPAAGPCATIGVIKGGPPVLSGVDATLFDADSPDFDGGLLSTYANASGTGDVMSILGEGSAAGQINVPGHFVSDGGIHFATIHQPSTGTLPSSPAPGTLYLTSLAGRPEDLTGIISAGRALTASDLLVT